MGRENLTRIFAYHEFCISNNQRQRRKEKQVLFGALRDRTSYLGH